MASPWPDSDFELQSQPADWMDSGLMHEQTLSQHGSPPVTAGYQGQASSNSSHGSLISQASEWSSHIALNRHIKSKHLSRDALKCPWREKKYGFGRDDKLRAHMLTVHHGHVQAR